MRTVIPILGCAQLLAFISASGDLVLRCAKCMQAVVTIRNKPVSGAMISEAMERHACKEAA